MIAELDIVAEAIDVGLFEMPFQSAEDEIIALLEMVAEAIEVGLLVTPPQSTLAANVADATTPVTKLPAIDDAVFACNAV